jgi:ferredoxin
MLGEAELDEGYTLTCVAYPQSDLTLETRETP